MKYSIKDNKLNIIIDELGEEYKDLLIEQVLDEMQEVDPDLINPSDIIGLDVSNKSFFRVDKKDKKKSHMMDTISILGNLYAIIGLILILLGCIRYNIQYNSWLIIPISLLSIGLSVSGSALSCKRLLIEKQQKNRGKSYVITQYEVINKWKELEGLLNQLTPEQISSLHAMLLNLRNTRILSEHDLITVGQLLKARNQIVHGEDGKCELSQNQLKSIFQEIDNIIYKLERLA